MAAGMQAIGRFGIGFFSVFMLGSEVKVFSRRADRAKEDGRLLEFSGGTSMRPILAPASPKQLPIDGGTRVEVRLKKDPAKRGGLLCPDIYGSQKLELERLIAAVAPCLNVEIAVSRNADSISIARPGDWISMSEAQIVSRLNPQRSIPEDREGEKTFIRPLTDTNGRVVGRAFIEPDRYFWQAGGGWVTVSGLRANQLRNVQGILLGEADTASRDAATPLADATTLAAWATEQAQIVSSQILDEERQAKTAEVVIECGGEIGDLKIIKWGSDWLNREEFVKQLRTSFRLHVSFSGEFTYDEDADEIHPKEFRQNFRQAADVAYTLKQDGAILKGSAGSWPKTLSRPATWADSNVAMLVRFLITQVWGEDIKPTSRSAVVGTVNGEDIRRDIDLYEIAAIDDDNLLS
jgi:hypothetical protein